MIFIKKSLCKIIICAVLMTATLICGGSSVLAFEYEVNYDEFLLAKGMPQTVVDQLPEKQKELIYSTLSEDAVYSSFDKEEIYDNESNASTYAAMPTSAMTLTVVGFEDSTNYYAIYPSFVWNTTAEMSNDAVAMALSSGWETVPGENNLAVWRRDEYGDLTNDADMSACVSSDYGYGYIVSRNYGLVTGEYEAHSYLHARKKSSSASNRISLCYADDVSSNYSATYNISITAGTASISGTLTSVRYRSAILTF